MADVLPFDYEAEAKRREQANASGNVTALSGSNPDLAAIARQSAKELGLPPEVVQRNPVEADRQLAAQRAAPVLERSPGTAAFLAKPENAAVAHDQIDHMGALEKFFRGLFNKDVTYGQTAQSLKLQAADTMAKMDASRWADPLETVDALGQVHPSLARQQLDAMTPAQRVVETAQTKAAQAGAIAGYKAGQARIEAATPKFDHTISNWAYSGLQSIIQNAPGMAASIATRNPAPALMAGYMQQQAQQYGDIRARGGSPGQAALGGALSGSLEVATEYLPLGTVVDKFGKVGAKHFFAELLGKEIPSEIVATITQSAVDTAIANPDKTWGDWAKELPGAIGQTVVATAMQAGAVTGAHKAVQVVAEHTRDQVGKVVEEVRASKLRERSLDAFKDFIASAAPDSHIYVPAESVRSYLQTLEPAEAQRFVEATNIGDQLDGASDLADIVFPVADYAAHVMPEAKSGGFDGAHEAFADDLRTDPAGLSVNAAKAMQEHFAEIMGRMDPAATASDAETADTPAERVRVASLAKWSPHMPIEQARQMAALEASHAEAYGKLHGHDAWTEYQRMPLAVTGEVGPALRQHIDMLDHVIDTAQAGGVKPQDRGPSLLTHIAANGGLEDAGGELAAMDIASHHKGRPGVRKVVQDGGRTLGDMAQKAQEAGYFPDVTGRDVTPEELLAAIREELAGNKRHAIPEDERAASMQSAVDDLNQIIAEAGLDPAKASRAQIRAAVEAATAERSGYDQLDTESPAFKRWFGDSKVIDAEGKPLVVYHGTAAQFDAFDPDRVGDEYRQDARGFFFTDSRKTAEGYARNTSYGLPREAAGPVVAVYLALKNPLVVHIDMDPINEWDNRHEELQRRAELGGHDGVIIKASRYENMYVAFAPTQIKSIFNRGTFDPNDTRILYQANPWAYSALARAVDDSKTTRASPAQWKAALQNTPGIKKEELEWSGVLDWLDTLAQPLEPVSVQRHGAWPETKMGIPGQHESHWPDAKGNITHEQLQAFLKSGGVRVDEVVLGEDPSDELVNAKFDEMVGELADTYMDRNPDLDEEDAREAASDRVSYDDAEEAAKEGRGTKWEDYKLPGADDTYRELLLTLPNIEGPSTHWDQPSVMAHVRFTDRTDADGNKVLFIEELQSDWHQKGREKGYAIKRTPEQIEAARAHAVATFEAFHNKAMELRPLAIEIAKEELEKERKYIEFTRQELVKARAEEEALAGTGVGGLGSERGANLRKIGQLEYSLERNGLERLTRDLQQLEENSLGEGQEGATRATVIQFVLKAQREDTLKDPAQRAQADELKQLDLRRGEAQQAYDDAQHNRGIPDAPFKTGWPTLAMKRMIRYAADGGYAKIAWTTSEQIGPIVGAAPDQMSWFYGRNLINDTNAIIKKYGAKVGEVHIPSFSPVRISEYEAARRQVESSRQMLANAEREAAGRGLDTAAFRAHHERHIEAAGQVVADRERGKAQPGFDITPELAAAANAGFALFQREGEAPRGRISFPGGGEAIIELLKSANASTPIHEFGHFLLEKLRLDAAREDAPPEVKAMWQTMAGWLGNNGEEITREQHEQGARGLEAYVREGKSPSRRLRDVFRKFALWMGRIYKSATDLNVTLSDDVRGVFDRLLASQDEIAAQAERQKFNPIFATAKDAGMTNAEFAAFTQALNDGNADAEDRLLQKYAAAIRRKKTKAWVEERKGVKAEVAKDVDAAAGVRAFYHLTRAIIPGDPDQPLDPIQLDKQAIIDAYGLDSVIERLPRTAVGRPAIYTAEGGMHPDAFAELYGYSSGRAMLDDLIDLEAQRRDAGRDLRTLLIDREADARMDERHGDPLNDGSIEREALDALHEDSSLRRVSMEVVALGKKAGDEQAQWTAEALRQWADKYASNLQLKNVRPDVYLRAERQAGNDTQRHLLAGDEVKALERKRQQLLNMHLYRATRDVQQRMVKADALFERIVKAKADTTAKARNMDLVNVARAILEAYNVGRVRNDVVGYMKAIRDYDPEFFAAVEDDVNTAVQAGKPIEELRASELDDLFDLVSQLWKRARADKVVEIEGRQIALSAATAALSARLGELGADGGEAITRAPTAGQKVLRQLSGLRASLRRVEHWANLMDGGDRGVFHTYVWRPISAAAVKYRGARFTYQSKLLELVQGVQDTLKRGKIEAPELGYTFGHGNGGVGKGELLHALLHTGNESNYRKLLLGYGWATEAEDGTLNDGRWRGFIDRMHREGVLTQADYDFAQGVWDLLEAMKPAAQATHRKVFGRYFAEVTANAFSTPFGRYAGGYVPAVTDQFLVNESALRAEADKILDSNSSSMFPAPSRGFTKSRVENYTKPLALDLGLLPQHVDKVLVFTHMSQPARDVLRVLKDKELAARLANHDPVAMSDLLLPWLNRSARQIVEKPTGGTGGKAVDNLFRMIRVRTGANIMFANVSNALQQFTGLTVAAVKVKPRHLTSALWQYIRNPAEMAKAASDASPFMATHTTQQVHALRGQLDSLLLDPTKFQQATEFAQKHSHFLQSATQNIVDVIVWKGGYEQAIAQGLDEREAVLAGDGAVRQTQGSFSPEDVASAEVATPLVRALLQFYSYFGNQANLLGTEFATNHRDGQGVGRAAWVYMTGLFLPAVLSGAISMLLRGDFDPEDEDSYLPKLLELLIGSQVKYAAGMVPVVGSLSVNVMNRFNDKQFDDRLNVSPVVSTLEGAAGTPYDVWHVATTGKGEKALVRDSLTLVSLMTGVPTGLLVRPGGYLADIHEGKVTPTGPVDMTRGLITGAASQASRN